MVLLAIDTTHATPLYQQIVDSILIGLGEGSLNPGEKLPTVRQLAADLDVNMNTVAMAYKSLAELGLVEVRQGSGARIVDPFPVTTSFAEMGLRDVRRGIALFRLAGKTDTDLAEELDILIQQKDRD